jgi:hypothetical protein
LRGTNRIANKQLSKPHPTQSLSSAILSDHEYLSVVT